jgi:osmotically-inducible protein OsmY
MPETLDVHVEAFDGVVVLSGLVETSRDRHTIESAVLKVPMVTALVQELETVSPTHQDPFPAELARAALKQLRLTPSVLTPGLKLVVEHGWLRLEGVASSQRVRDEAVRRIRGVKGARGVIDRLLIVELSTVKVVAD